jgi:hypothetical protein
LLLRAIADFQIGGPSAGWDTCGTADLEVCATSVQAFSSHYDVSVHPRPLSVILGGVIGMFAAKSLHGHGWGPKIWIR